MAHGVQRRLLVGAIIATACLTGCQDKKVAPASLQPTVTVLPVRASDTARWVQTFGQTQGLAEVDLRSEVSGILKQLAFTEGESVKAGQVLFYLNAEPFEAALTQAKAQEREQRVQFEQALREYERAKKLYRSKALSQQALEAAQTHYLSQQAILQKALAQVKSAQVNLNHTQIKAPVDGVAGLASVHVGSLIQAQSTLLGVLTQPKSLRVHFSVADSQLTQAQLHKAQTVLVSVAEHSPEVPAQLDYIGQRVDPKLGTVSFRAQLMSAQAFRPGQFVSVRMKIGELKGVFKVPQKAVRQKADGTYAVFVYHDGKAHERIVKTAHWEGKDWVITHGLKAGDQVIVDQLLRLRDQMRVTVRTTNATPAA